MAYRTAIISLVTVTALAAACSKAPTMNQKVTAGESSSATSDAGGIHGNDDHGPKPEDSTTPIAANTPATPATDPAPVTKPTPPPAPTTASVNMAMLNNKTLFAVARVTNQAAWGTSATARIKVPVAVDAAGAVLPPAIRGQTVVTLDPKDPTVLLDAAGVKLAPATVTSMMVICNDATDKSDIYLHSSAGANTSAFAHGNGPIKFGTCAAFPASFATTKDGATYDHIDGNNAANFIYLEMNKISPTGAVVP